MPENTDDLETLKTNEYFAKRWWELARLDYKKDIVPLCLISCEDLMLLENRILIDIRRFRDYTTCHFKGSFNMYFNM